MLSKAQVEQTNGRSARWAWAKKCGKSESKDEMTKVAENALDNFMIWGYTMYHYHVVVKKKRFVHQGNAPDI